MATAAVNASDLLGAVKQVAPEEFDAFLEAALALRTPAPPSTLSPQETKLIERINRGLPAKLLDRFAQLTKRRRREGLSTTEQRELLRLTHEGESRDADRASALLDLAKLRRVPVRALMKQMGIEAPPTHG